MSAAASVVSQLRKATIFGSSADALAELDDRMLADIGLTRADL